MYSKSVEALDPGIDEPPAPPAGKEASLPAAKAFPEAREKESLNGANGTADPLVSNTDACGLSAIGPTVRTSLVFAIPDVPPACRGCAACIGFSEPRPARQSGGPVCRAAGRVQLAGKNKLRSRIVGVEHGRWLCVAIRTAQISDRLGAVGGFCKSS